MNHTQLLNHLASKHNLKEYLEIGVKNDEQLIKMSTIVQRALNSSSGEESLGITEEEKQQLMEELEKINSDKNKK